MTKIITLSMALFLVISVFSSCADNKASVNDMNINEGSVDSSVAAEITSSPLDVFAEENGTSTTATVEADSEEGSNSLFG